MERPYLPGAYRCVNAAQKYPGLIDRGESRQVGSKHSERGPLDALSGACRVVRRLSKHYAVREDLFRCAAGKRRQRAFLGNVGLSTLRKGPAPRCKKVRFRDGDPEPSIKVSLPSLP